MIAMANANAGRSRRQDLTPVEKGTIMNLAKNP